MNSIQAENRSGKPADADRISSTILYLYIQAGNFMVKQDNYKCCEPYIEGIN